MAKDHVYQSAISESPLSKFLFTDVRLSIVWLILRLFVGWLWIEAGYEKITNNAWVGTHAGQALHGFLLNALKKNAGPHPDVSNWYAAFISQFVLQHTAIFSFVIAFGELLVGIALILGIFTGIAAFFGAFMNMNYLLAGTISINPILFLAELFLILAWRTAGYLGVDRFLLPLLGVPWHLPRGSNVAHCKLK